MPLTLVTHKPPATGFGRYAAGLARALWADGHDEVRLLEMDAPARAVHHRGPDSTRTVAVPGHFLHPYTFYRSAWRRANIQGPVHITNQHLAWLPADQSAVTVHDLYYLHHGAPVRRMQGRLLYRAVRRADAALVTCATQGEELAGFAPDLDVHVAPPGIDGPVRAAPREGRRRQVLHVGSVDRRKNLPAAIGALEHLPDDVRLVQVGAPPARRRRRFERLARRLGVADRVDWRGAVDDATLAHAYATATALLHPSLYEGFGYPAFEAMAAGTPVVASDIPVFQELLGAHATLRPPRPRELAAAVGTLLDDGRAWAAASERATACARRYQWGEVLGRTLAAYETAFS